MSQSIHLFTIRLYLFETLLSILVLKKKKYNTEKKTNKKNEFENQNYFDLIHYILIMIFHYSAIIINILYYQSKNRN